MNRAGITARRASMVLVVLGVVLSTSAVAPAVSASTASRDDAPGQGPAIADAPQQHPPRNAAPRMSVLAAAGGDQHLWFVDRRGSLSASLGHIAVGMAPREFQQCIPLQGPPSMIASFGERAFLLFPPRSAILPRYYLLSTSARRNPASGLWMSVPSNRLELLPALPCQTAPQSMVADSDGPLVLFESEERLWRMRREQWTAIDLPEPLAHAKHRLIEPFSNAPSILATTGSDQTWERWRLQDDEWTRSSIGLPAGAQITPLGGPAMAALVESSDANAVRTRRIVSLPDDGPIELATLDASVPEGVAAVWFRGAPVLLSNSEGPMQLRRIDPVTGLIEVPIELEPQRSIAAVWGHLPILAALVISLLMVVFFVRSLRDESEQRMPEGWEPLPFNLRLLALAIDLIPGVLLAKLILGAPWSSFIAVPWLVVDSDAALPTLVAPIITVLIGGLCETAFGTTLGKRLVGGRVISMRSTAGSITPTGAQTLARNLFKAVVLQMQLLAIFTLIHPLGQGVGETVSATAVVRRRMVVPAPIEA